MTTPIVAYVIQMTEHERGWGQRPDGYLVFGTEADGKAYVIKEISSRISPVAPDIYVSYDVVGYKQCAPSIIEAIAKSERQFIYVDHLKELKG